MSIVRPPLGEDFNSSTLLRMFEFSLDRLKPEWQPKKYLVLNLPAKDFEQQPRTGSDIPFNKFSDMKPCAAKTILFALSSIVERRDLGNTYVTSSGYQDHYFYKQGVPKTVQIFEELKGEKPVEDFLGFRLWLLILDPDYDLAKGFSDLIAANSAASTNSKKKKDNAFFAFAAATTTTTTSSTTNTKQKTPELHETIDSIDALGNIWSDYLQDDCDYRSGMDESRAQDADLTDGDNKLNPFNVLNITNAIKIQPSSVCQIQSDEDTYFDTDDGVDATNFRSEFVQPDNMCRFNNLHFHPQGLRYAPLPNCARTAFIHHNRILERETKKKQEAEERLVYAREEGEKDDLLDKIADAEDRIQRSRGEIEEITQNIRNNGPQSLPSSSSQSFLEVGIDDILKERNKFTQLFEHNEKVLNAIKERNQPATEEYESIMDEFWTTALSDFWKAFVTDENVTPPVKAVRSWIKGFSNEDWWYENNQFVKNLTIYGNMIVRMTHEYDKLFKVETNFQLTLVCHAVALSASEGKFKLRPHVLMIGEGGRGKSFIMKMIELLSAPGTVINATHITSRAFETDQDISDLSFFLEEINEDDLGIDKYGKTTSAPSQLKNRMSSEKSVTVSYSQNPETKKREAKLSVNACRGSTVAATNGRRPPKKEAIMQRFLLLPVKRMKRRDVSESDGTFHHRTNDDPKLTNLIKHRFRIQHAYLLIVEKAIESGALPDVEMGVAKDAAKWIFEEMENGDIIPFPPRRQNTSLPPRRLVCGFCMWVILIQPARRIL